MTDQKFRDHIITMNTLPVGGQIAEIERTARRAALLVSPDAADKVALEGMLRHSHWTLDYAGTIDSALSVLQNGQIPIVITERDLPQGDWKDILAATQQSARAPLLIVFSRLADEYLWSEVLNLGGHDVLSKPFRETEVRHVFSHAWRIAQRPLAAAAAG